MFLFRVWRYPCAFLSGWIVVTSSLAYFLSGWIHKLFIACWLSQRNGEGCFQHIKSAICIAYFKPNIFQWFGVGGTVKARLAAFGDALFGWFSRKLLTSIFPMFRIRWIRYSNYAPGSLQFYQNSKKFQKKSSIFYNYLIMYYYLSASFRTDA